MDNVIGYRRHAEVTHNANDQEHLISHTSSTEISVSLLGDLGKIDLEHIFLDLTDDATENIGHRQPKEYIEVSGKPYSQGMLKAIKNGNPKNQWAKNGQDHQLKSSQRIYAECSSLKQDLQNLAHPLPDRIPEIIGCLVHRKFYVVSDPIQNPLISGIIAMGIFIPFRPITITKLADVHLPGRGFLDRFLLFFQKQFYRPVRMLYHCRGSSNHRLHHAVDQRQHQGKGHNTEADHKRPE